MRYIHAGATVASYTGYLLETLATLAAVCVLAVVVLWGARRLGVGRPTGAIALCGHLPLDSRRAIYLVRVGAQVFVVAAGEGGFTKLGEVAAAELGEPSEANGSSFADVLGRVLARPRAGHAGSGGPPSTELERPERD